MTLRITIISLLIFLATEVKAGTAASSESYGGYKALPEVSSFTDEDTKSFIIEQARKKLSAHFTEGKYRYEIQPRWIPNRLLQQTPEQIIGMQLQGDVRRYTNFEVVYQHGGSRQRVEVQLKVTVEQKVPVVTDRIESGTKLTEDKLTHQWVSMGSNSGTYISNINELIGKTLRRTLLSGQPVPRSYVSRDIVIKAGDEVRVIIERNGVQVQLRGEAREDGAEGDRIKIYSNETRRKYVGEIIRPGVTQWKSTL